jgi:hypothetical protein
VIRGVAGFGGCIDSMVMRGQGADPISVMQRAQAAGQALHEAAGAAARELPTMSMAQVTERWGTTPRRAHLLEGLEEVLPELRAAGIQDVIIGGSMLTSKRVPGDLDVAAMMPPGTTLNAALVNRAWNRDVHIYPAHVQIGDRASFNPPLAAGTTFLDLLTHSRTGNRAHAVRVPTTEA